MIANISQSLYIQQTYDIVNKSNTYKFPDITITLHTEDRDFVVQYPLYLDIDKYFNKALIPTIEVSFLMPLGDYRDILYNNMDSLECTITYKNRDKIENYRYTFILTTIDKRFKDSKFMSMSTSDLNKLETITVKGQCVNTLAILLKRLVVNGIYHNVTPGDLVKGLLTYYIKKTTINNQQPKFVISMDEPDNNKVYEHISIESRTKLIKLPYILNYGDYGIYNGGIATYIDLDDKNVNHIYIFPFLDYKRYDSYLGKKDVLHLYNSITTKEGYNDKTYYYDQDGKIYNMVISNPDVLDKGNHKFITIPDNLVISNPYNLLNRDIKIVTDDEVKVSIENFTHMEKNYENRTYFQQDLYGSIDNNIYKYRENMYRANVIFYKVDIGKADLRFIYPGMKLMYYYNLNDTIYKLRGVVQSVHYSYNFVKKTTIGSISFITEREGATT